MKIGTDGVLLGAWACSGHRPRHIIDVGCGSGLIALMLAQRFGNAHITAIEIDSRAADEARENVAQSPWADRIEVLNCNFIDYTADDRVDAIVSNPPFFDEPLKSPLVQRAVARHQALLSPASLIEWAATILDPNGTLSMIAPAEQSDHLIYNATLNRLDCARLALIQPNPYSPPIRVMLELNKGLTQTYINETLIIRSSDNKRYTEQYRSLTQAFYLDSTFN